MTFVVAAAMYIKIDPDVQTGGIVAFHVSDPATDAAVRRLAKLKGKNLTQTIREAAEKEYERECAQRKLPLWERLKPIHDRLAALAKPGGSPADKAFYDELSGEDELSGPL